MTQYKLQVECLVVGKVNGKVSHFKRQYSSLITNCIFCQSVKYVDCSIEHTSLKTPRIRFVCRICKFLLLRSAKFQTTLNRFVCRICKFLLLRSAKFQTPLNRFVCRTCKCLFLRSAKFKTPLNRFVCRICKCLFLRSAKLKTPLIRCTGSTGAVSR